MDKEKKRQEEKVKQNLHIPVLETLIFSYLNFMFHVFNNIFFF